MQELAGTITRDLAGIKKDPLGFVVQRDLVVREEQSDVA